MVTVAEESVEIASLSEVVNYLGVDYFFVDSLIQKGLLEHKTVDGVVLLNKSQFEDLKRMVSINKMTKDIGTLITSPELRDFCISLGYFKEETYYYYYKSLGLFSDYEVVHPFTKRSYYKQAICKEIVLAVARGGIVTLKNRGFTKSVVMKELGLKVERFRRLVNILGLTPTKVGGKNVYSTEDVRNLKFVSTMDKTVSYKTRKSKLDKELGSK